MISIFIFSILTSFASLPLSFVSEGVKIKPEQVLKDEDSIWGFDFLPEGKGLIYTLRSGKIKIFDSQTKKVTNLNGVPSVVHQNQGGMLDVFVDPDFKNTNLIYFTYSTKVDAGQTTRIAQANIEGKELKNLKILFTALPGSSTTQHYGSRIVKDKNGYIYFTVGERGERNHAQRLDVPQGKIFRMLSNGGTPQDNPFTKGKSFSSPIWSYGHRNPQGLAIHPKTGELWSTEHGPRGGDEINLIKKGLNYGWPVITYGKEYWGPSIGDTHKKGMEQPQFQYTPSIATCGLAIHSGKMHKQWENNFFIGSLKFQYLSRVKEVGGKLKEVEKLLEGWGQRIRNVKEGPDGSVYVSTDDGQLIRLVKADDSGKKI